MEIPWLKSRLAIDSTRLKQVTRLDSSVAADLTRLESIRNWHDSTRDSTFEWFDTTHGSICRWLVTILDKNQTYLQVQWVWDWTYLAAWLEVWSMKLPAILGVSNPGLTSLQVCLLYDPAKIFFVSGRVKLPIHAELILTDETWRTSCAFIAKFSYMKFSPTYFT
jgi:hypothetical protein